MSETLSESVSRWFAFVTGSREAARRNVTRLGWGIGALFLLLGTVIRCVDLQNNPPGLWQDEASSGLDAWLLWHTGRDRTGAFMPLISRSFGDYPLALYRYLTAPVVGLGGLTIANERIVAALFGTLLIVAAAAVTRLRVGAAQALAVVVVSALSPNWIHFSRYGSEAILLPATLTLGWLGIEIGARSTKRRLAIWLGAISLGLSAYTYHAVKLILPLWMAGFLIFQAPQIAALWRTREKRHVLGPAAVFALIVLPSVWLAFSDDGQARGRTVLAWYHYSGWPLVRTILNNYLSYYDPGMLFVRGGPAVAQSIPDLGMWNLIELPLILIGFAVAFRTPTTRRFYGFILFWFLLGPLPGGVTYETHNMGRAIAWLPAPQILSATGLAAAGHWIGQRLVATASVRARFTAVLAAAVLIAGWTATTVAVFRLTLVQYPQLTERDWQFAVSRAFDCARRAQTDEKFIVSGAFPMAILFAQFHLADRLLGERKPSRVWDLGERSVVGKKELVLLPAGRPAPKGERICTIVQRVDGRPAAFVYRAPK